MKFFYYDIQNNKIDESNGEISGIGDNFHQIQKSFGVEEIYCKTKAGRIIEIICEAFTEQSATKAVNEYLATFPQGNLVA